jgi:hypothetical protein
MNRHVKDVTGTKVVYSWYSNTKSQTHGDVLDFGDMSINEHFQSFQFLKYSVTLQL